MDPIDVIVTDVVDNAVTCDVYEKGDSGAYDSAFSQAGTADVYIFSPSSSSQVVTEGAGQETSLTGLVVPSDDANGDLVHDVAVGQQLRVDGKRYDVRVKDGLPDELDPKLWQLGLERANTSQ